MRNPTLCLVLLSCMLPACGSDDSAGGGNGKWSASHPAQCGLAAYSWLPADQVGGVLEQNVAQELSVTDLQSLQALLTSLAKISHPIVNGVSLHVIRYQTQDKGKLVEATAMVGIPKVSAPTTFPILEFLHGTAGYDDGCAPSRNAKDRTKPYTALALLYAGAGYVSVLPDYIGMKSLGEPAPELLPYLIPEPTAIASLDAVRAAKKLVAEQAPSVTFGDVVVAGHSQGGHATEATTRFAPYYAPELHLAGAAFLAAPTDLVGAFNAALNGGISGSAFGLGVAYSYLNQLWFDGPPLSEVLVPPWDAQAESVVKNTCNPDYQDPLADVTDLKAVFQPTFTDALAKGGEGLDKWSCYLREDSPVAMSVPVETKIPALYVLGELDNLVYPEPQRKAFESLCQRDAKLIYLECAGADHGKALTFSLDDQLDFFSARLKGDPLPNTVCQVNPASKCSSTP